MSDLVRRLRESIPAYDLSIEAAARIEAAEARAERLREALEAINKGNEQTTYMHLGTALAIARKALEDDKQ